jgi:hypothetical protein
MEFKLVEVNIGGYPATVVRDDKGEINIKMKKEFAPQSSEQFDAWVRRAPHFIFIREVHND